MSRHRLVRDLDYDDYYDDAEDDEYDADDVDLPPPSPTTAALYMAPQHAPQQRFAAFVGAERAAAPHERLLERRAQDVLDVVGDVNHELVYAALHACDLDVRAAIQAVLGARQHDAITPHPHHNIMFDDNDDTTQRQTSPPPSAAQRIDTTALFASPTATTTTTKAATPPSISSLGAALAASAVVSPRSSVAAPPPPPHPPSKDTTSTAVTQTIEAFAFDTPSPDTQARFRMAAPIKAQGAATTTKKKQQDATKASSDGDSSDDDTRRVMSSTAKSLKPLGAAALRKRTARVEALIAAREGASTKPALNLVVVGHVDAGKSTLLGHLLYASGAVSARDMHRFEKESRERGKASFKFAWVMDVADAERSRGVTVDVAVQHVETARRSVTLLDAPGHRDFVPNMIAGAAQADAAVLVVDAITGEFESGFDADGQTKEHAILLRSLGVSQLIVAVNKLDAMHWSQQRYEHICGVLRAFLKSTGFKMSCVRMLPCSGLTGENLATRCSPLLSAWYTGDTLLQMIDSFDAPLRPLQRPFRMVIGDVFRSHALGLAVAGTIQAGCALHKDRVLLLPAAEIVELKNVHRHDAGGGGGGGGGGEAVAGDRVDVGVVGVSHDEVVGVGSVLCDPLHPVPMVRVLDAKVLTLAVMKVPLVKGAQLVLHCQHTDVECTVTRLSALLNRSSGEVQRKRPRCVAANSSAVIRIALQRALPLELYAECRELGRFQLRRHGRTVVVGIVSCIVE